LPKGVGDGEGDGLAVGVGAGVAAGAQAESRIARIARVESREFLGFIWVTRGNSIVVAPSVAE
jgi:hypothetical protein